MYFTNNKNYSLLRASIGSSSEALQAGYAPLISPTKKDTTNANNTLDSDITAVKLSSPPKDMPLKFKLIIIPIIIPNNPPNKQIVKASVIN